MPITFPATDLAIKLEIQFGTTWTDVSTYVLQTSDLVVQRGTTPEETNDNPSPDSFTFTLDNGDRRFAPRNTTGPYFGLFRRSTQVRVSYDPGTGYIQRFQGSVPNWSPKWITLTARTVTIEAVDAQRRLQAASPPLNSPIYNSTVAAGPVHYVPLEEGSSSTTAAAAIGANPVTAGAIQFGAESTLGGSKPDATFGDDAFIAVSNISTRSFHNAWQVDWFMNAPTAPSADVVVMRVYTSGDVDHFEFVMGTTAYSLDGVNDYGVLIHTTGDFADANLIGTGWIHYRIMAQTVAGTTTYQLVTFPANPALGGNFIADTFTGKAGGVRGYYYPPSADKGGFSLGHIAVYARYNFSAVDAAGTGYQGESPTSRFLRVAAEAGIPATVRFNTGDGVGMGPQSSDNPQAILNSCAIANEGYFDSDPATGNLRLTSRTYMYNRAVDMVLDYSTGVIAGITVDDSDFALVNQFTASRDGGGTVTVTNAVGPLSTQNPPVGVGPIAGSQNYVLSSDDQVSDHAQFRLYQGTVDELRITSLVLDFARAGMTTLLNTWRAMDSWARVQIINFPAEMGAAGDTIDVLISGYTETFNRKTLRVDAVCVPARLYNTFNLDSGTFRVDSTDTFLLTGITSSQTTLLLDQRSYEPVPTSWAHNFGDYTCRVTGEDMTVTACSTYPAVSFVGAGTASTGANGSRATAFPAGMVKGDLMLLFASTRLNDGTAWPNQPTSDWVLLLDATNWRIFGKIYDGVETAPTVSFTNDTVNEDTLAQVAVFRGAQARALLYSVLANGSAQNVSLSDAINPARTNTFLIYAGWKRDDWTSAGGLGAPRVRIGAITSVAGNDASMVWDYELQPTPADAVQGFWTITGGAAAVSSAGILAVDGNVQTITVTRAANGAVVPHAAGDRFSLTNPIVLANRQG